MLQCSHADPARQKIAALQKEGKSDDSIIKTFIAESGLSALAVPPAEGFNLLAWWMPYIMLGVGLIALLWFMKRYNPKHAPASSMPEVDPELLARYRDRIDKEVSKLE